MIGLRTIRPLRYGTIAVLTLACAVMAAGTKLGDIEVNTFPANPGNTHRGYTDHRFLVENKSPSKTHKVTLSLPKSAFGSGDSISQLSRMIEIGPASRMTVSIPQPPLDMSGSSGIVVSVAGGGRGSFEANRPSFDRNGMKSVLLSRSINEASLGKLHGYHSSLFSAAQVTGRPDAIHGGNNVWSGSWIPGVSTNKIEWIELDFGTEVEVSRVDLRLSFLPASGIKLIELQDKSGKVVTSMPGPAYEFYSAYSQNLPTAPVLAHKLRLEFDKLVIAGKPVCLDAVSFIAQNGNIHWAKSAKVSSTIDSASFTRLTAKVGASLPKSFEIIRAETEPALWSDTWLGYTPFTTVLLAEADFKDMPGAVQSALSDYVATGGNLIVIGQHEPVAPWKNWPQRGLGFSKYNVGFGEIISFDAESVETLTQAQNNQLIQSLSQSRSLLPESIRNTTGEPHHSSPHGKYGYDEMGEPSFSAINTAFPVVDRIDIPTVGILLIMFLYILVVGPINLIILHVKKLRIWTLWTIPAFALATSLLILFYSLASEGVRSTLRIEGTTLLDQANHRAYTTGLLGIYAPITPGNGLRFDYNTEVTPLIEQRLGRNEGVSRTVDWTTGQHLKSGWVQSRTPAHFGLRKPETRRERITLERDPDGTLAIVNGLGADIEQLWLRDDKGMTHHSGPITGGARSKLTRTTNSPTGDTFQPASIIQREQFTNSPPALIRGSYYAILQSTPFLETPLPGKLKLRRASSVYGILEPAP